MNPIPNLALLLGALMALSGCGRPAMEGATDPDVIARVGELVVTQEELRAEMERRARFANGTGDLRRAALEELIRHKVLLANARKAGYDSDPEVRRQIERLIVSRFRDDTFPDLDRLPAPTREEIEAEYNARLHEFILPERVRVSLIRIDGSRRATAERRAARRAFAEEIRAAAAAGDAERFKELARTHSADRSSRYSGGDVGWVTRGASLHGWDEQVLEAMFELTSPGEISPVIEAEGDLYILRLAAREPSRPRALAEVSDQIAHGLILAKRRAAEEEYESRQRAGLSIEVHEAALARVAVPDAGRLAAAPEPPRLPAR